MNTQICCFTGHRKIDPEKISWLRGRLEDEVIYLFCQGVHYFLAGGALGFDTMAALAVLKLKSGFPEVRLDLILPCRDQSRLWNTADIEKYNLILSQADEVVYTSDMYFNGCMQRRDRYRVENSQICVCYLTKTTGGTAYTVRYAEEKGLTVFNLAPV